MYLSIGAIVVMFMWWQFLTGKYPKITIYCFILPMVFGFIFTIHFHDGSVPALTGVKNVPVYSSMVLTLNTLPVPKQRFFFFIKTCCFFGYFYVIIPHCICIYILGIWGCVLLFLSSGPYYLTIPKGWFDYIVKLWRWGIRVMAYFRCL